ncbi:MAG: flagellar basal body-associated FliL family protein [Myxococcales bacterium]|nr:flagellar basal body-associated FliL family protein [Myxococcales bacterium]
MSEEELKVPTKGRSRLIVVLAAVNLLAIGGVAYFMLSGQSQAAAEGASESEPAADTPPKPRFGPLIELPAIVANLKDPDAGRYVKVRLHLEVEDESKVEPVNALLVPIRSEALFYFSGITVEDTLGEENKERITEELFARVQEVCGEGLVRRLFFSEFVVQ